MKGLIRKILKENDLEWAENIDSIQPLRFQEVKAYFVGYSELERFIESVYGKDISIPAMLESSNDVTHEFNTSHSWYSKAETEASIDEWLENDEWISLGDILYDLSHNKGLIPNGKWMVRVSW